MQAVFEAKQQIDRAHVEYASAKASSVRRLHRTSATIPFAAGTYPKKEPPRILAGLLTYESGWNPAFGQPFQAAIAALSPDQHLDLGITGTGVFRGELWCQLARYHDLQTGTRLGSIPDPAPCALAGFGTVPAIDYDEYDRMLEIEQT